MANGIYIGVNGVAKKVPKIYVGVNGVARKVAKAYIGDANGKARLCYTAGTEIGSLPVGTTVYTYNGATTLPWIIVHQGLPSSAYDSSCNGTWLWSKYAITQYMRYGGDNDYNTSTIQYYFTQNPYAMMQMGTESIKNIIKTVNLPCTRGSDFNFQLATLSTKLFVLSGSEMGFTSSDDSSLPTTGSKLSYFAYGEDEDACEKRKDPDEISYWTRDPVMSTTDYVYGIQWDGGIGWYTADNEEDGDTAIRPAFILPSTALVDEKFIIIA